MEPPRGEGRPLCARVRKSIERRGRDNAQNARPIPRRRLRPAARISARSALLTSAPPGRASGADHEGGEGPCCDVEPVDGVGGCAGEGASDEVGHGLEGDGADRVAVDEALVLPSAAPGERGVDVVVGQASGESGGRNELVDLRGIEVAEEAAGRGRACAAASPSLFDCDAGVDVE